MEKEPDRRTRKNSASVFKAGTVCLVFLIIGFESALFVRRAAELSVQLRRDSPDTVYVVDEALARRLLAEDGSESVPAPPSEGTAVAIAGGGEGAPRTPGRSQGGDIVIRKDAVHPPAVEQVRQAHRKVESFRFDPNTAGQEDLMRLGFSEKQAAAIVNYRAKGGRFRRKEDFAKSFVVADSVYKRLEPYISIPKIDINKADSAAFDTLPGIGGYFAARMVSYRAELGGYSFPEQLMDIRHFDREKYDGLKDLISCSPPQKAFALWSLPADELKAHPYIRDFQTAKAIVLYRDNTPRGEWTVEGLAKAGIIKEETAAKLARCRIETPAGP